MLAGATLTSAAGPALLADQATIAGDAFRCDHSGPDFRATGSGDLGAVCLSGAHVGGQLCLRAAALTSKNGPALEADAVTVDGDALLDLGFTATGEGPRATLGLRAAAIGGRQAVVSLAEAYIGGRLSCTGRAAGGRPGTAALDLGRAQVGGLLLSTGFGAVLNVDGLACAEEPVLLAGNPPSRVPEVRQAAEWRLLIDQGTGARARGTLTRLGQALHLARPAHRQVPDTVPFPRLDPPLPRLVPPPAGAASS